MDRTKYSIAEVRSAFTTAFDAHKDKFSLPEGDVDWAKTTKQDYGPGVYVWWHPDHGALKVGVSAVNARNRALELDTPGKLTPLHQGKVTV